MYKQTIKTCTDSFQLNKTTHWQNYIMLSVMFSHSDDDLDPVVTHRYGNHFVLANMCDLQK